jgi:O-methyltransferase involved in polyketide biosynthesis
MGCHVRCLRIHQALAYAECQYPEVITLRQKLFPPRDGYSMIASSITAETWLDWVPSKRPTLIIAEGVLEYLTEADVQTLLNRLTTHFQHGQIAFDVMNTFAVNAGKRQLQETTGATHRWAVDDTSDIARFAPHLRKLSELSVMALPALRRLPWRYRILYTGMRAISQFRNMIRLLRYEF